MPDPEGFEDLEGCLAALAFAVQLQAICDLNAMPQKCWNLCYVAGNPALFTHATNDASSPMTRAHALEGAQTVAQNGWRVWVEHTDRPERIFESYQEIAFRSGAAPSGEPDSATPGAVVGGPTAPLGDTHARLQYAAVVWWESMRSLNDSLTSIWPILASTPHPTLKSSWRMRWRHC